LPSREGQNQFDDRRVGRTFHEPVKLV